MKNYRIFAIAVLLSGVIFNLSAALPQYSKTALKQHLRVSRATVQKSADHLAVKTLADNKSAVYQLDLDWKTSEIKQLVVTAKVDKPGRLRFSCNTLADGKKLRFNCYLPATADGKFHDYVFDLAGRKNYQGVLTNYEIRWFGPADTLLEIKKIAAVNQRTVKLAGSELKGRVRLFKAKPIASKDELLAETTNAYGGFHQQNLAWSADEINVVSFLFKSDKPGTLRYACSLKNAPKSGISMPLQKVPGDGKYHLYTFKLYENKLFSGTQSNYELRFTGPQGAVIGLKEITAGKKEIARTFEEALTAHRYELKTSSTAGADGIVKTGEVVTLKVQALRNGKPIADSDLYLQVKCFSDGEGSKIVKAPIDKEFVWSFDRKEPGRAYISCRIKSTKYPNLQIRVQNPRNSQHIIADHGIGIWADPHKQRIQRQEPADFDKFWNGKKAELARVPLKVLEKVSYRKAVDDQFDVYDVKIACAGPVPVSGIITIPKDRSVKYPAWVQYHGAGIRSAIAYFRPGAITFNVNAHGLPNGREKAFYDGITFDKNRNPYKQSAEKRFEMFQYMFLRALRALEYVKSLPEWNQKDLIVSGGSQGGVQTIAAAALDKSVTLAAASIPAMIGVAEFTIRKNVEPAWPNPYVHEYNNKQDISNIAKKFDYVDGAFFMRRITCPLHVSIGLYDVIAAHVFAAYNDCPAKVKSITSVPDMGHYNYNPAGNREIRKILEKNKIIIKK